jgi:hypothetical protein
VPEEAYRALVVELLIGVADAGVARGERAHFDQLLDLTNTACETACERPGKPGDKGGSTWDWFHAQLGYRPLER